MKNNLSEKLKVKATLKPVTYQLIGAGQKDFLTGKPMFKSGANLPGVTTIYDPYDENGRYNKTIRYIIGEYADAKGEIQYEVGAIDWDHTNSITVRPENYALYEFLERHNGNKSNPFRDETKPAIFERVDFEARAQHNLQEADIEFEAISLARSMKFDEMIDYARSLGVNVSQSASEIRHDMYQKAKANPADFVANSNSLKTKTRSRLSRAQEEGVIEWVASSRQWRFVRAEGHFLIVSPGINHFESLTDFVVNTKDGELVLREITKRLGLDEAPAPAATILAPVATQPVAKAVPVVKKPAKAKVAKVVKTSKKITPAPAASENTGSTEGTEAQ